MTDNTNSGEKSQLHFIMDAKIKIWQEIHDIYHKFVKTPAMIDAFGHCQELHRMKEELRQMSVSIGYATTRMKNDGAAFTWATFMIVDEDLKTRANMVNILFTKLKVLENN